MRLTQFGISLIMLTAALAADTVTLKDGRVISGTYLGGSPREVKLDAGDQVQTLDVANILRIEFNDARERRQSETSQAVGYSSIELPAGTSLVIRMIDGVDSERNSVGQTFAASLDEPVIINGKTVIPRGADVVVKLVDAKESGKLTGRTTLTLDLMIAESEWPHGGRQHRNGHEGEFLARRAHCQSGRRYGVVGHDCRRHRGRRQRGCHRPGIGCRGRRRGGNPDQGATVKIPSETRLTFVLENVVRL